MKYSIKANSSNSRSNKAVGAADVEASHKVKKRENEKMIYSLPNGWLPRLA